jgi:tetratricopeptide (TPR) repeat protein
LSPNGDYAAILKSYAYQQSFDPDSYQAALAALNDAHSRNGRNGRNGIVSSMLAVLHVDNITLEFFDRSLTPLARARHLAQEGVQLDPVSQFGRLVLARVHLLEDDLDAGLAQVDKAQALQPTSLLHLDLIGYLRVLLGDWERGEALVRQAIDLNPFHEVFTRYATYLCFLHRGDVEQAMEETQWLEGVGYFWDPLARAACLGLLGRRDEAREAVAQLLALKPDFAARGAVLIGHCVKCPDLRRMMAEGLAAGGLRLDDVAG